MTAQQSEAGQVVAGAAVERVLAAYARIAEVDRPEVWIDLRPREEVLAEAAAVDARSRAGEVLALAGLVVAVKGNIDVAGIDTTAGCPSYAYRPAASATVVQRLVDAGAVVVGTTNLDQFATGLVGTRSPHGAVRDARRPDRVSGGSSSGSAVAVALGLVDVAVGTDTAGSGRVPAAFQGVVGLKPTRGLLPATGVVPACRELDCVSVFAPTVALAELAAAVMSGPDGADPLARRWPPGAPLAASSRPVVGIPGDADLAELTPAARTAFGQAAQLLAEHGAVLVEIDPAAFLDAGQLLYGGAFVAERYAAVGAFLETNRDDPLVDPTVAGIVLSAREVPGHALARDRERLDLLRHSVGALFAGGGSRPRLDAVLLPTVVAQPTIAEVRADPVGANARLGRWTTGTNLLDLCAVAVPAGVADGGQFGVSIVAPAFADRVAADLARLLRAEEPATDLAWGPPGIDLVVVGAHLSGQPLNGQLTAAGARLVESVSTAAQYRLHALDTVPGKPGLARVGPGQNGSAIEAEVWRLPATALAELLASLPQPMALGPVELADGRTRVGFLCQPAALAAAPDISSFGGWRGYLAAPAPVRVT